MADETLRRNLDAAFDPGPSYPDPLLLSRTMALLQAHAASTGREGRWKGRERSRVRWPRTGLRVAAVLLMVVLAIAAVGVYLVAHGALTQTVPAGLAPPRETIAFGRVNASGAEYIFTIRADGTGEKPLVTTPTGCCGGVEWSHQGDRLLLGASASSSGQPITTATVKADGSDYKVLPLDSTGLNLGPGRWSPDDSRIAFEGWSDSDPSLNGIYTADATDGGNRQRVTTTRQHDIPISYSPDGSRILFYRGPVTSNQGQLFLVGVNGGDVTLVSPSGMVVQAGTNGDPGGWSPNGAQISFAAISPSASDPGRSAVFVAAGDGTNPKQISDWGTWTTSARWSPTGDWIVFDKINFAAGAHGLFLVHPDGSGTRTIPTLAGVCCAVWSPAGDRLLFLKSSTGGQAGDLWTVNVDGSHLTRLTHTPASLADLGWGTAT